MFNVGPGELIAILALALIVLGPNKLPEAVRTAGRVVGELRRISSGFQEELRNALEDREVENELDRLRSAERSEHGERPELPPAVPVVEGAVQYPTGVEPLDVDGDKDPAIDDDPPDPVEPDGPVGPDEAIDAGEAVEPDAPDEPPAGDERAAS